MLRKGNLCTKGPEDLGNKGPSSMHCFRLNWRTLIGASSAAQPEDPRSLLGVLPLTRSEDPWLDVRSDFLTFPGDEDPRLPLGGANIMLSSTSCPSLDLSSSDVEGYDEETSAGVETERVKKTKKKKKKKKKKVRPDPPRSSLSTLEPLDILRERSGIPEEILLDVPRPVDRADDPPSSCFTLYENFVERNKVLKGDVLYAKQNKRDWDAKVAQLRS